MKLKMITSPINKMSTDEDDLKKEYEDYTDIDVTEEIE